MTVLIDEVPAKRATRVTIPVSVTTPMFLGGVGQAEGVGQAAEWRTTSLRGVLRYWFRALAGRTVGNDLAALSQLEAEVFGSTHQASPISLRLRSSARSVVGRRPDWLNGRAGLTYLLGQGLVDGRPPTLTRDHFAVGSTAAIDVRIVYPNREVREQLRTLFVSTLWFASALGGLGARVHRGFGGFNVDLSALDGPDGVYLDDLNDFAEKFDYALHETRVRLEVALTAAAVEARTSYPVFSSEAWSCQMFEPSWPIPSWANALNFVGAALRAHRAPIASGRASRTTAHRDVIAPFIRGVNVRGATISNAAFGLPMAFGKKDVVSVTTGGPPGASGSQEQRRGSAIWLRPVRFLDSSGSLAMASHAFSSTYLPDSHGIFLGRDSGAAKLSFDDAELDREIDDWHNAL